MDCKVARQHMENNLNEDVMNHLAKCKSCQAFYEDLKLLEQDLYQSYSGHMDYGSRKEEIMKNIRKKRPMKLALIAAMLCITLTVTFAEDIPLIGDLLRYFRPDESAQIAREIEYPIEDLILIKDEYKLYVKDFFFDPYHGDCKIALEKNGEMITGFSYGLMIEDSMLYWREERNESTPWSDVNFAGALGGDYEIRIGIRDAGKEVIFDPIEIKAELIEGYQPRILNQRETFETEYGDISIDEIEIYPTAMYLHVSYDLDPDVYMFHFYDLQLIDNNGKAYKHDVTSIPLNDEKKQVIRIIGSCYNDQSVDSLSLEMDSIGLKYFSEFVNMPLSDLEGYAFKYEDDSYALNKFNKVDDKISFTLTILDSEYPHPIHMAIYDDGWEVLDKIEEISQPMDKNELKASIPLDILNEWLGMEIKLVEYVIDKWNIYEDENPKDPYWKYQTTAMTVFTRAEIEDLLSQYGVQIPEKELDYIYGLRTLETQWFNVIDLEVISGMSLEELKTSDEGKLKLVKHLRTFHVYRGINEMDHFIKSVEEYGSLGLGGKIVSQLKEVVYEGKTYKEMIKLGLYFRHDHEVETNRIYYIK